MYVYRILNHSITLSLSIRIVYYVLGLGRYKCTESYLGRFLGYSLDTFLYVRSMCFLYKLECSSKLTYLKYLLFHGQFSRSVQLVITRFEVGVCKKSLFVQGLIDWNSKPVRARLMCFDNDVRNYLTGGAIHQFSVS